MCIRSACLLDRQMLLVSCVAWAVLVCGGRLVRGQEPVLGSAVRGTGEKSNVVIEQLKPGMSVLFKDPETGEVIVLPPVAEEILEEVQARTLLQRPTRLYDLQKLSISGVVAGEFAKLEVTLQVNVIHDKWVQVPVGFGEFQLTDLQHSSELDNADAVFETTRLPSKSWRLRGKGIHQLKLNLIGAVRSTPGGRRRLRIDAPRAGISHLLMDLADRIDSVDMTPGNSYELREDVKSGRSILETYGLTETTELSWTPRIETGAAVTVQANGPARMELDLTTGSLVVNQMLSVSGGSIDRLQVTLPDGYGTASISGRNADGNEVVRPVEDPDGHNLLIEFTAPVTGSLALRYDIGLRDGVYPQQLNIRVPDVEGVSNESGDLEVFVPVGLEVVHMDSQDVRQRRVETSRGTRTAVFGYRLLSAQSSLDLQVSATEAFYSVVPEISFETESSNVLLTARFSINVLRGSLSEVNVLWPGYRSDAGWEILEADTRLIAGETTTPLAGYPDPQDVDSYTIRFPERQSGQFEVELQAFRPRSVNNDTDGMTVVLPDIESPTPHTAIVALVESDEFSMSMSALDESASFPLLPSSRWPQNLRDRSEALTARLVDASTGAVLIRITPQRSEVRVSVQSEINVSHDSIYVSQIMSFDVRHLDKDQVTLTLPQVNPVVRLEGTDEPLERISLTSTEATYALPAKVRGEFRLRVDYYWPPQTADDQTVDLPLLLPAAEEQQLTSVMVGTNIPESLLLQDASGWKRVFSRDFAAAWMTDQRRDQVTLRLKHKLRQEMASKPDFIVLKSVLRGRTLQTYMTAVFPQPVAVALFSCPDQLRPIECSLGNQSALMEQVVSGDDGAVVVQVRSAVEESGSAARSVTLVVEQDLGRDVRLFSIWEPELPRILGADEDCDTIWVIAQSPSVSLMYWGQSMTELGSSSGASLGESPHLSVEASVNELLALHQPEVRSLVMDALDTTFSGGEMTHVLAGAVRRDRPMIVSLSRQGTLLIAAVVSLLVYFAFLILRPFSLVTTIAVLVTTSLVLSAIVPGPGQSVLLRLIPGAAIAILAAVLQRLFGRQPTLVRLEAPDYDQSTIFSIEQPVLNRQSSVHRKIGTTSAST